MKNYFQRFSIFVFIFALFTQNVFAFYDDIPENHRYFYEIKSLYDLELLPEDEDNLFHPDETLTISDFYKILLTFGKAELSKNIALPYSDISADSPYAPYIQTALNLKLLEAQGLNPTLNPARPISKIYALKTMFSALGLGVSYFFDKSYFPFGDLSADSPNAPIALKAAEVGIFEDENPNLFLMAKRITKAEFVNYLYLSDLYASYGEIHITLDNSDTSGLNEAPSYETLQDVWENVTDDFYYQENVDEQGMIFSAIEGLVNSLGDQYTKFERPVGADSFLNNLSGEYEGIGVSIEMVDKKPTINAVFKDSPGAKAGLKANDVILEVDGKNVSGLTIDAVSTLIRGEKGTSVKIKISRDGKSQTFEMKRDSIVNHSVTYKLLKNSDKKIAYIDLFSFGENSYEEFVDAAKKLIAENPSGFIIDLRDDPGGYMDVAINIIGLFSDKNITAVKSEYSNGQKKKHETHGSGILKDYKTVVLVNENTASAAEIVAGALQDYNYATVIGTQTFGKGSVQKVLQYEDGSLFKFTIAKWLTPKDRDINKKGIRPDKVVKNSGDIDKQLEAALAEF